MGSLLLLMVINWPLLLTKWKASLNLSKLLSLKTLPTNSPPKPLSSVSLMISKLPTPCSPTLMLPPPPTLNKLNPNSLLKKDSLKNNKLKKLLPEPVSLPKRNNVPFGKPTTNPPKNQDPQKEMSLNRSNKFSPRDSKACPLTSKRELIMTFDFSLYDH